MNEAVATLIIGGALLMFLGFKKDKKVLIVIATALVLTGLNSLLPELSRGITDLVIDIKNAIFEFVSKPFS